MSNILIKYFNMFNNFKNIKFIEDGNNAQNNKISVVVPFLIANYTNEISIDIFVKNDVNTLELEEFLRFLNTKVNTQMKDDFYSYTFTFSEVGNIISIDKIGKYQLYTLNLNVFVEKKEI